MPEQTDLKEALCAIRKHAIELISKESPSLSELAGAYLPEPLPPMVLLPWVGGKAVNAPISTLVATSAAVLLSDLALRIVDDCADQDNPGALYHTAGTGRAMNLSMLLTAIASGYFSSDPKLTIEYHDSLKRVCAGQELDMNGRPASLDAYKKTVALKTVAAYRFALLSGCLPVTSDTRALELLSRCGENLGWMAQILDDIEALWFPVKGNNVEELHTFPFFYGVGKDHPNAQKLAESLGRPLPRSAIRELLDEMNVREELLSLALDHRDETLTILKESFLPEGVRILNLMLNWLLRDAGRLVSKVES